MRTPQAVAGIFVLQIVLYGYTLLMFERSTQEGPLATWASAIWLIITTMTTVGYGDVYPTTRMGRVVAISASFSAMAMMAITISLVQSSLAMNRSESKVVWLHNGRSLIREKRNTAGKVVLATLRVNMVRKRCLRVIEEAQRQEMGEIAHPSAWHATLMRGLGCISVIDRLGGAASYALSFLSHSRLQNVASWRMPHPVTVTVLASASAPVTVHDMSPSLFRLRRR